MARAKRAYEDGRFLEASEKLADREPDVGELSPRKQADYGIYRGLSLMMLGDARGAQQWLTFAYEVERLHPGTIEPEQRAVLDRGWWQLSQLLGGPTVTVPSGSLVVPSPTGTVIIPPAAPPP